MFTFFLDKRLKYYFLYCRMRSFIFSESLIYVIGDSHTLSFRYNYPFVCCHLGPSTAYSIPTVGSKTASYEKLQTILKLIDPKMDFIILSFGEIDARNHINKIYYKQNEGLSYSSIIEKVADRYFTVVDEIIQKGYNVSILGMPPANKLMNVYHFENYATPEQQKKIKQIFNEVLLARAYKRNLLYIELLQEFSDEYGFIEEKFSADQIHLSQRILYYVKYTLNKHLNIDFPTFYFSLKRRLGFGKPNSVAFESEFFVKEGGGQ
jgi:lysophospholipase L1-like esterase